MWSLSTSNTSCLCNPGFEHRARYANHYTHHVLKQFEIQKQVLLSCGELQWRICYPLVEQDNFSDVCYPLVEQDNLHQCRILNDFLLHWAAPSVCSSVNWWCCELSLAGLVCGSTYCQHCTVCLLYSDCVEIIKLLTNMYRTWNEMITKYTKNDEIITNYIAIVFAYIKCKCLNKLRYICQGLRSNLWCQGGRGNLWSQGWRVTVCEVSIGEVIPVRSRLER